MYNLQAGERAVDTHNLDAKKQIETNVTQHCLQLANFRRTRNAPFDSRFVRPATDAAKNLSASVPLKRASRSKIFI